MATSRFQSFALFLVCVLPTSAVAGLVVDFTDPTGDNGFAGEAFESTGVYTVGDLSITVTTTGPMGSDFYSAVTDNAGVGDDERLDVGESLTLTFTGSDVRILEVNWNLQSGGDSDAANLTVGGTLYQLFTGTTVDGYDAGSDIWTPAFALEVGDGESIVFTAADEVGLQSMTIALAAIPEPTAFLFGALVAGCVGMAATRQRPARPSATASAEPLS